MTSTMNFCNAADGARLAYRQAGTGTPMLLIAGLAGEGKFWNQVIDELATRHNVIVFDQRGFGASGTTDSVCTIDLLASDAIAIMDAAGVTDAIVAGHSTGGAIAQTLALDHSSRVSRLVLSSTWAKADDYMQYLFALRSNIMRAGGKQLYAEMTRIIGYPLSWLREHPEWLALPRGEFADAAPEIDERVFSRIAALLEFDRASALGAICQPTLVLGARDDQIIPNYLHVALQAAIPGASGEYCSEGGHFFPSIMPRTFIDPVRKWLDRLA